MKTPISASKRYVHRLLKPHKYFTTTHLRRLSVAPDSTQPPSQEELTETAITQLKITEDWTSNTNLHYQLLSLPPQSLIKIARHLETSNKALKFFHFIHDNQSPSLSQLPLPSIFQTVIELAMREEDSVPLVDLFNLSKELKVPLTSNSAILLIRYFFHVKKVQESLELYNELEPHAKNTNVKNTLLGLLLKSNRFEDAHKLLDEMLQSDTKFPPNETTLSVVFSVLLRWNCGKEDEKILGLIPKFGIHGVFPCNVWLTQLITRLCRSHRNDKAWDLLHELIKFGKLEAGPCNALLSGLSRERNYKRINLVLNEMKENNIKPDIVTFGMLVNHLCKAHRVDDALDMLKKMKEGSDGISIKPDVILYNTVIDGLCKVGRQAEGFLLMEQMKSEHNCAPNVVTYNCLIDGFCKSGEIERAHELFDQMDKENVAPNVITMNTLVDGMCKNGRISNAMEFFRKMQEEKGIKGNAVTYSTLISAFCNVNNMDRAMRLFDEMESLGSPDALAYYSLISGLTLAGRPDDAAFIASKMKKSGFLPDLLTYNTLIGGFCRKKKLDKAVEILKDMEDSKIKPDSVTYNTLISYFTQNGDFGTAHKFLKQMVKDGNAPTVVTYGTLIHGHCLAGNLDEGLNLFEEMIRTSKVVPNNVIYNILIDSLCKCGKVDHALSLMDGMLEKGVAPNTTTYNAMLKGISSRNRLKDAERLMNQMTTQACNPDYITIEILNDWFSAIGEADRLKQFVQGFQASSSAA
ncbi:unnamed protein product [Lactuca saligna]|uniref:Pentacotripeptide-repeat region of PRORP domain-containing protein n=1 Tax=Lactuca saligna TaxID=75948 RepID=A0AA36ED70_LACSI|nr:unnamed protein product [Lactuca saligna]